MKSFSRTYWGLVALVFLGAVPFDPATAAQIRVQANAKVVKALTLTAKQDLDFGLIMPAATGTSTVSMSTTGVISCPSGSTCTGAPHPAIFNVQGSNQQVVRIFAAPSDLVNAANGSTIRFTPTAPASVTLTNSGFPGVDFNIGGSLAVPSTADGIYTGNVEVTVDYQ